MLVYVENKGSDFAWHRFRNLLLNHAFCVFRVFRGPLLDG